MRWYGITDVGRGCDTSDYGLECTCTTTGTTGKDNMSGHLTVVNKDGYLSLVEDLKLRVSVRCMCLI